MIRNIYPADESSLIREDIRRLTAREAFLRRGFLGDTLPRFGDDAVVEVAFIKTRKFLSNKLPQRILDDAAYWEDQQSEHIRVRPR